MTIRTRILLLGLLGACATVAFAADQPAPIDPRVELAKKIPGTTPDELHVSPIPGIYELAHGTDVAYVTADGKYAISGDLYELKGNENLTEVRRRDIRQKLLANIPESDMLIFSPRSLNTRSPSSRTSTAPIAASSTARSPNTTVSAWRVRYMFYPRSGPNTESWTKAEQVWCSTNRNEALTRAKLGEELKSPKTCGNSPVARDYAMGKEFDVRGTPSIVMNKRRDAGRLYGAHGAGAAPAGKIRRAAA